MTANEAMPSTEQPMAVDQPATPPAARPRQTDQGPEILPSMERFVTLVRKCKRPALVLALVERAGPCALPALAALVAVAQGALPAASPSVLLPGRRHTGRQDTSNGSNTPPSGWSCWMTTQCAQAVQALLDEADPS